MSYYTTDYWADLFAANASDLAWPRMRAWIAHESGGNPSALGKSYEVGIGQLDLQDGPAWGGTLDTLHGNFSAGTTSQVTVRDLTADEEQLQVTSMAAYVRHALGVSQSELAAQGLTWSDDDLWCLVKLQHALPDLARSGIPIAAQAGQAGDWDTYRAYLEALPASALPSSAPYSPWSRLFDNAELVGKLGLDGAAGIATLDLLSVFAVIALVYIAVSYVG